MFLIAFFFIFKYASLNIENISIIDFVDEIIDSESARHRT